ncbi:hypothetical protein C499_07330 [Halogeometricum borinquense DSM 11551]|uniref:Uncharacterized protein n=1 Tax=Halogeometricum borinquense (strain ATCC 700274 / DSM 11551 / JCM 10706 / KCTC 4070 / PR3) TaxID=469382 RepID=E4NVG3_HALBP|nr:hypothetical protein [Halogeometricum borinquense]ADQ68847.1 hypothetical protein Hbor_33220 [Halogeometricum borinquense DSM 11551]ELY28724.1 hypothetical protein C499_07330 [Halogeometricum borinquense DSM 11551]
MSQQQEKSQEQEIHVTRVDGKVKEATVVPQGVDINSQDAVFQSGNIGTQFVGTEPFWNNMDFNRMSDILSWVSDAWRSHIEDGSGDYESWFTAQGPAGVTVPSSALPSSGSLAGRLIDADDWLQNNESDFYDGPSAIVIIDYYGQDSNTYGVGYEGTAGDSDNKSSLADVHHEDNNNLPTELSEVKADGTAFHELLHLYNSSHPADVSTRSASPDDEISIMYSWDGVSCSNNGSTEVIVEWVSNCAENSVHSYIDSNF